MSASQKSGRVRMAAGPGRDHHPPLEGRMAMRAFLLVASAFLLSACQTAGVQTDFDPAANFSAYRTYSWLPSEAPRGMNPLMFRRI